MASVGILMKTVVRVVLVTLKWYGHLSTKVLLILQLRMQVAVIVISTFTNRMRFDLLKSSSFPELVMLKSAVRKFLLAEIHVAIFVIFQLC